MHKGGDNFIIHIDSKAYNRVFNNQNAEVHITHNCTSHCLPLLFLFFLSEEIKIKT